MILLKLNFLNKVLLYLDRFIMMRFKNDSLFKNTHNIYTFIYTWGMQHINRYRRGNCLRCSKRCQNHLPLFHMCVHESNLW